MNNIDFLAKFVGVTSIRSQKSLQPDDFSKIGPFWPKNLKKVKNPEKWQKSQKSPKNQKK